jgi:hypothetical protein
MSQDSYLCVPNHLHQHFVHFQKLVGSQTCSEQSLASFSRLVELKAALADITNTYACSSEIRFQLFAIVVSEYFQTKSEVEEFLIVFREAPNFPSLREELDQRDWNFGAIYDKSLCGRHDFDPKDHYGFLGHLTLFLITWPWL